MKLNFSISKKQKAFIDAKEDQVLYGGAAGGGKTFAQIIDAFLKAVTYPGIKQIIFRNSFPELNRSVVLNALTLIPKELFTYSQQSHKMTFKNGSIIEFGYLSSDSDVSNYQSAEYDIIRFDELTHFTEYQYKYMGSRIRGANAFPKQIKSSTNPGSRGHAWVKAHFVTPATPGERFKIEAAQGVYQTGIFIPALVQENKFLMEADPSYITRLKSLPESEMKALLYGDWDIYEGQYFSEFKNDPAHYKDRRFTHVIDPFDIPEGWRIYRSFDFGYAKPFSVAWWAVDYDGRLYRILELYGCKKGQNGADVPNEGVKWPVEEIFKTVAETEKNHAWLSGRDIYGVADPSIWDKSRGISVAETAEGFGVYFEPGDNARLAGWMQVRYRLAFDENGIPMMYVFSNCKGFIRTIPSLQFDNTKVEDLDTEGEDHIADEVRYMCMANPIKPARTKSEAKPVIYDPLSDEKTVGRYEYFLE